MKRAGSESTLNATSVSHAITNTAVSKYSQSHIIRSKIMWNFCDEFRRVTKQTHANSKTTCCLFILPDFNSFEKDPPEDSDEQSRKQLCVQFSDTFSGTPLLEVGCPHLNSLHWAIRKSNTIIDMPTILLTKLPTTFVVDYVVEDG